MLRGIDKPKEPPKIAVRFANMFFVLSILFSILIVVFTIYRIYNLPEFVTSLFYIIVMLCGVAFATIFGFGLKILSNNLKVNLSVLFFAIGITVYGFETYLEFFQKEKTKEIIAKQMGVPYDLRTTMEVLDDLRDAGVEAYPNVGPTQLLTENGVIYNLGGIANITTILHNESGYYPIIETDEYGFNNPKGLYNKNEVDIVLIGDSFTEGKSVHSNETISAVLREFGSNTISLGKGGNGPLIEFATLKEYAEPLKPKIVMWLYFMNDFSNLSSEMKSPILKKYFDEDDYSQNLISRQEEIDAVLINYAQVKWLEEEEKREREIKRRRERIRGIENSLRIIKLYNLRNIFNIKPASETTLTSTDVKHNFKNILKKSKQMVMDWDGKMYFVYLPPLNRYLTGKGDPNRDFVMQTATELDIPIIDIHSEAFDSHPDPLSLFPFRMWVHYNAEGYRLVAETIGKRLEADGYVTIQSNK